MLPKKIIDLSYNAGNLTPWDMFIGYCYFRTSGKIDISQFFVQQNAVKTVLLWIIITI